MNNARTPTLCVDKSALHEKLRGRAKMKAHSFITRIACSFLLVIFVLLQGCGQVKPNDSKDAATEKAAIESLPGASKTAPRDPNRLWCNEHNLYEDECTICHPELANKKSSEANPESKDATPTSKVSPEQRDPNRLWCNEHSVYEDECTICHPELANKPAAKAVAPDAAQRDPNRLWCKEHSVYEDECLICHPELGQKPASGEVKQDASIETSKSSANLQCKEHNVLEQECGICHPDLLASASAGEGMKVRFASENSTTKAGVVTSTPSDSPVGKGDDLLGEVSFNRNALAMVTPIAGGVVREVFRDVGDTVSAGDVLATVHSLDLAEAKNEYVKALAEAELARQVLAREKDLFERKISARQDYEEAQAAAKTGQSEVTESQQHLMNLGLQKEDIELIVKTGTTESTLAIRAPLSGTIIERNAVVGTAVEPGIAIFQVVDLSKMWMEVSIPESRLAAIQTGTKAQARFDAYPGIVFEGEVTWVAPSVHPQTRMVPARIQLQNTQGLLRSGLFGRVTTSTSAGSTGLAVPASAVQDIDGRSVVFKKLADDLFEARVVSLGETDDGQTKVLAGLDADDEIVTAGSYTMKSELLKMRLGAGCTDH
jgi:cobalt-zinc-cadmium efflux system membrane fusion protein